MKKIIWLSLVGITSIAFAHAGWTAGHPGGFGDGGFHGGDFGGGGGNGYAGAPRNGGGGFRGGPYATFRVTPSFRPVFRSGVRIRTATDWAPASARLGTAPVDGLAGSRNPGGRSPARVVNRAQVGQSFHSSRAMTQRSLNGRTDHIYARHDGSWHSDWDHHRAHFSGRHWWVFDGGAWIGLDAGFFPWDYYPYYAYDYYPYDYYPGYYADVQPYYSSEGVYDANVPAPDSTVSAAQTRLIQLGYYNGAVDGIFGPQTRDALARYQIDSRLTVTGSLSIDTLQALGLAQVAKG